MKQMSRYVPILLLVTALGCADTGTGDAVVCGEDTELVDNQCVPLLTCGPNTTMTDSTCIADTDYACGADTDNVEGVCIADPGPTCGEGTVLVDNECIIETHRICGTGTVEIEGECLVEEPRTCGFGTTRVGDECVPDPQCSDDAVIIDERCVALTALGDSPYTACTAVARDYCNTIADCCGPYDPFAEGGLLMQILWDPAFCQIIVEKACLQRIALQLGFLAAGEVDPVDDPHGVLAPYYSIESCLLSSDVVSAALSGPPLDVLVVEPNLGPNDSCLGNLSCIQPLTCVTQADGNAICKEKGADAHRCDPGDHEDCRDGYFCRHYEDGSDLCAHYLSVGSVDCSSNRRCDPDEAFCSYVEADGVWRWECVARLEAEEPCTYDGACQEGLYCRNYYDADLETWIRECTPYQQRDDTCGEEDWRCGPGLFCNADDLCAEEVDICYATGGGGD